MSEPKQTEEGNQELCVNCKGRCQVVVKDDKDQDKVETCGVCKGTGIKPHGR